MNQNIRKCDEYIIEYIQKEEVSNKESIPILLQYEDTNSFDIHQYLTECGCNICHYYPSIKTYLIHTPINSLKELVNHESITNIKYDREAWILLDNASQTIGVNHYQNESILTGENINIAVLDTGVYPHKDLTLPTNRILAFHDVINGKQEPYDDNGHGTHVIGCIASNGISSNEKYIGIAPKSNIIAVKCITATGKGNISSIIKGIEWVIENKEKYNIKIISMSLGTTSIESYKDDPICQILEEAWNNGITVIVAAGNSGPKNNTISSPANHPLLITVGSSDDRNTNDIHDDVIAGYSSRGPTLDGIEKPDVVAPGTNIISLRSPGSFIDIINSSNRVSDNYFTMSGTSMATPITAGLIALLFETKNNLEPNEIKSILTNGAIKIDSDTNANGKGLINLTNSLALIDSGMQNDHPSCENISKKRPSK